MIVVDAVAKRFAPPSRSLRDALTRRPVQAGVAAVEQVSFSAADACITGLLGPNGAGKTTTLRMLAGLITPDAGRLSVDGIDVAARPREALARMGVLSDARGLYPRLSARENIVYYGALQGLGRSDSFSRSLIVGVAIATGTTSRCSVRGRCSVKCA
jgi:sodium transport system ATP-binding protein